MRKLMKLPRSARAAEAAGIKLAREGTVARTVEEGILKGKAPEAIVKDVRRAHRGARAGRDVEWGLKTVAYYRWLMEQHSGVRGEKREAGRGRRDRDQR